MTKGDDLQRVNGADATNGGGDLAQMFAAHQRLLKSRTAICGCNFLIAASALSAASTPALAQDVLFRPIIETRLRYESVDQDGPAPLTSSRDADAVTVRMRAGGELSRGPLAFLAEGEATLAVDEDYNSGVNGKTLYPLVADPETVELNRLQLQYRTKALVVTVGRQRINLDDQRFVGSVTWRQNEQTFDALRVEYTGIQEPEGGRNLCHLRPDHLGN